MTQFELTLRRKLIWEVISGTGKLSDYSEKTEKKGGGKASGASGKDPCDNAFATAPGRC